MASVTIDYVVIDGTDAKIGWSASGLSQTSKVYVMYFYAVRGSTEIYLAETVPFAGPSKSTYDWVDGLAEGTTYKFRIKLYNTSGEYTGLSYTTANSYTTPTTSISQKIYYYSGSSSDSHTITGDGYLLDAFNFPSGFTFEGWATSPGTIYTAYEGAQYYEPDTSSAMYLYGVFSKTQLNNIRCYYGVNKASVNYRDLITYAYNTSKTARTTKVSAITLPYFNQSSMTVLGRTFTAIGWRKDTSAASATYDAGGSVTPSDGDIFYAVYSNSDGIRVTYNANGGSGSMSGTTVSGTLYYNTSGRNTTINVTPRACTFTPPTGKKFVGWSTTADGSNIVTSVDTAYNVTFYAIWVSDRPPNWAWEPEITKGSKISITATHWNNFISRIQAFADYKGVPLPSATKSTAAATSGSKMLASQANAVRTLISKLPITISLPSAVSTGDTITAAFMNGLMNSLNSIP